MFQITSKAGIDMGLYPGDAPEEAFAALCSDLRVECERRQVEYDIWAIGRMDDFDFTPVEP